jgi:hypothetical protein
MKPIHLSDVFSWDNTRVELPELVRDDSSRNTVEEICDTVFLGCRQVESYAKLMPQHATKAIRNHNECVASLVSKLKLVLDARECAACKKLFVPEQKDHTHCWRCWCAPGTGQEESQAS